MHATSPHDSPNPSTDVLALLHQAAEFCEIQKSAEGLALAERLRNISVACPGTAHDDFAVCEQLSIWNTEQKPPPIRVGAEYLVGMAAYRLCHSPMGHDQALPMAPGSVLVEAGQQTY